MLGGIVSSIVDVLWLSGEGALDERLEEVLCVPEGLALVGAEEDMDQRHRCARGARAAAMTGGRVGK
jgi:hypothetical protein